MKIRLLSQQLAAKIAAGEVVERPVSAAKELIENALDADARRVSVELRGGGVELLRVVDDGAGMAPEEVSLAFERHATSKLFGAEDLLRIGTLGFRGEALASIAAVAHVSLATRPAGADAGWEIRLEWGRRVAEGPRGCAPGTAVAVSRLFENVPARRKFLRSPWAEAGRVRALVSRYAMAYPEVAFHLSIEGRDSLQSSGGGVARDTLAPAYGAQEARDALAVEYEDPKSGIKVGGFVGPPSSHRANRRYVAFFVNRRWVQDRMLSVALEEAYHGLLPQGRYPVAALNLTIPFEDVDVNVHPTKAEVRFREGAKVFSSLQRAVRGVLIAHSPVPQVQIGPGENASSFSQPGFISPGISGGPSSGPAPPGAGGGGAAVAGPGLRVLGQAGNTYIVAEGPNGIFLLDQHAAHERALYDKLTAEMRAETPSAQWLLDPQVVELTPEQLEVVRDGAAEMRGLGFALEPFGEGSHILRAVPAVFSGGNPAEDLAEALNMMARDVANLGSRWEAMAASIACHGSVRAGKSLSQEEMTEIIRLLERTDNPHTCPHGRPTMLHLSAQNLERQFGRR